MKRSILPAACLALFASAALAQQPAEIKIIGPSEADVGTPVFLILDGLKPEEAKLVNWGLFPQTADVQFIQLFDAQMRPLAFFWSKTPGRYCIFLDVNVPGSFCLILHELTYGEGDPPPPPPPGELWALFTYETSDLDDMPFDQAQIHTSTVIRKYLDEHCAKDGGIPAYRFLDDDGDVSRLSEDWRKVFARATKNPSPWCIITNGRDTYEGEWPASVADALELLKKYGGE